jgi:hypothetical protein
MSPDLDRLGGERDFACWFRHSPNMRSISEDCHRPVGSPWMWTLAFGHHQDRTPTHGYEPTREAAMAAFAKSWRRA